MQDPESDSQVDYWRRVEALFERMQDTADPLGAAALEPDPRVAASARRLWDNLKRAEQEGFLSKPVELIPPDTRCQPQFAEGQLLDGRFHIERLLGMGGMGEVYLATDRGLHNHESAAIKTIRANLAADPAIRLRFLAEVQNARRVTHRNVCRINDIFEHAGMPFLSMQYLEGEALSTWLKDPARTRADSRLVATQLAEGLAAAHSVGILHCDFKPANVIVTKTSGIPHAVITDFGLARALRSTDAGPNVAVHSFRAGTIDFMAPELLAGGNPTIRTDIYAYGRVLELLLPGHALAARCHAKLPGDRPTSLEPVIRTLRGDLPRRLLFGAAIAATAAGLTYKFSPRSSLTLAGRTRIVINAFRAGEPALATVFRELLITALRQSTLLTVVGDDRLRSILKSRNLPLSLPVDRVQFASVAGAEIALFIEGALESAARGLKLSLDVFNTGSTSPALTLTEQVASPESLVKLADRTALRLRREFGESAASLQPGAGYTPLGQVTSANPEAIDCYFNGLREYKLNRADDAITWFEKAVQLDPKFALAWLNLGIAYSASFRVAKGLSAYQQAFELRTRVTDRERLWIETRFRNITGDHDSSIKSCLSLIALYPEEADFHRFTAAVWTRLGKPVNGLRHNRRAVELDATNTSAFSEWIVNTAEANLPDEALALFDRFQAEVAPSQLLHWGAGNACMGKEDLVEAGRHFREMGSESDLQRWAFLLRCAPVMLSGKFEEARSTLAADLAWDVQNGEQNHRDTRRVWLGMLDWMLDSPATARKHVSDLLELAPSPATLQPLREAGLLAWLLNDHALGAVALAALRQIEKDWESSHTRAARSAVEATWTDVTRAPALLEAARGLRPDPLVLFTAGRWHLLHGSRTASLDALEGVDAQRGRIYRHNFPLLFTLGRIERARCLAKMSRIEESSRLYEWVLNQWSSAGSYGLVTQVRHEYQLLK